METPVNYLENFRVTPGKHPRNTCVYLFYNISQSEKWAFNGVPMVYKKFFVKKPDQNDNV